MKNILNKYGELLSEVDQWFATTIRLHPDLTTCKQGCSACCRGLFDITIMDALYLRQGFETLPEELKERLQNSAVERLQKLSLIITDFKEPWFLNELTEEELEKLMPEDDPTPCIMLSEDGDCLVYSNRPMTCRLHGIPLFDTDGEPFSDEWCTLNFNGTDPSEIVNIRHPFRDLFYKEVTLFRQLTQIQYGKPINELDTIIPAAILNPPLDTSLNRA